ncbi:hypothetical protein ACFVMC_05080 [Nocardia sp. NPDC127579]|uniref:hypothetical protein n=1 Tax=Nocardia sp. NPDC127579 TaxID=3345402 RepID=UPI003627E43C
MTTRTSKPRRSAKSTKDTDIADQVARPRPRSTTGIRLAPNDQELLAKLTQPGETKADVIRRALHELDRREWLIAAQADAERIDASGEDLNVEPDAW